MLYELCVILWPKSQQVGVQISRGVHSEMSKKNAVRDVATTPWGSVSEVSAAKGKPDIGRASDGQGFRTRSAGLGLAFCLS